MSRNVCHRKIQSLSLQPQPQPLLSSKSTTYSSNAIHKASLVKELNKDFLGCIFIIIGLFALPTVRFWSAMTYLCGSFS